MKTGVLVFPGSNCDIDCYHVMKEVMDEEVNFIWHKETEIRGYDALIIPGGFSYGDYLRCGAIARFSPIMPAVMNFARQGGLIIGICNGFQILLEAGLLPGALLRNSSLKFICKPTYLKVKNTDTAFSSKYKKDEIINVPIAHGEGNYFCDSRTLEELYNNDSILFTYCNSEGEEDDANNPNGTMMNIAGIINKQGNVLGMMPHPERCCEDILGGMDGYKVFASMIASCTGGKN